MNEYQTNFYDNSADLARLSPIPGIDGFAIMTTTLADDGIFCRWNITTSCECLNLPETLHLNLFTVAINVGQYVIAYVDKSTNKLILTKANIATNTLEWYNSAIWDTTNWDAYGGKGVYDTSSDLIYNMINFNYNVMVYAVQVSDGTIQTNQWKDNDGNCFGTFDLLLSNSICKSNLSKAICNLHLLKISTKFIVNSKIDQ